MALAGHVAFASSSYEAIDAAANWASRLSDKSTVHTHQDSSETTGSMQSAAFTIRLMAVVFFQVLHNDEGVESIKDYSS
ncbi:uncharacterized protein V6R79_012396 [Siganus canaliculatus]